MNRNLRFLCRGALIAALYVVLTWLCSLVGLDKGVIQMRLSEALCVLPAFTGAAVPGLFAGCLLANLLTGSALPDIIFGSLATLIGALGAYALRKNKWLVPLPTCLPMCSSFRPSCALPTVRRGRSPISCSPSASVK